MKGFDRKSGQVYTETTSSRVRSMIPAWKTHVTGRRVNPQFYSNRAKGSSSLLDMAMRSCCWNIELFMPETLQYPGWHYAGMIYRYLKTTSVESLYDKNCNSHSSRDTLTFSAWTLFQQAYPNQAELSHHFRVCQLDSITSWSSIVKSLGTLNSSVLTHFCAYGLDLDIPQLVSLANIPTLTALIHVNPAQRNNNALRGSGVRDWCRAVGEKKAFLQLQLLFLSSITEVGAQDKAVLDYLSSFPALVLVGISRCPNRYSADPPGEYGRWVRPSVATEDELSKTMWDSRCSISEKTKRLYKYAKKLSLLETEFDNPVTLALTCAGTEPSLHQESISWFIRNRMLMERQPKRLQETQKSKIGSEQAMKKLKVRQSKQQDVGSLLGMFG